MFDPVISEGKKFNNILKEEENDLRKLKGMLNKPNASTDAWKTMSYLITLWNIMYMSRETCDFIEFKHLIAYYSKPLGGRSILWRNLRKIGISRFQSER